MYKEEVPEKVFEILGIPFDSQAHTSVGGTVTKQAWLDVLEKLQELAANGNLKV